MKTERFFNGQIDRYTFDFNSCSHKKGFAQVDTSQDASYFGTWANPFSLRIVTYAEGDITIETAETDTEFATAIQGIDQWNRDQDDRPHARGAKIDGMCDDEIIAKFELLGLHELLH